MSFGEVLGTVNFKKHVSKYNKPSVLPRVEPGVPYDVSIAAVNRAGLGEFSVFIHFTQELSNNYNIIIT